MNISKRLADDVTSSLKRLFDQKAQSDDFRLRLRTKLGDWGEKHIKTVFGVGYKIVNE